MRVVLALLLGLVAQAAAADGWTVSRVVRPATVLVAGDLLPVAAAPGALGEAPVGLEARTILYPGRPIRAGDVGPPALIERNALVLLHYRRGGLWISTDGRALGRGAAGERVRVMNLTSRTTVTGRIAADGSVHVSH